MNKLEHNNYNQLVATIGSLLQAGKQKAFQKVNTILVETYWNIGKQIIEFEQAGEERAEYGTEVLKALSKDLKIKFGKGFSKSNLYVMRQLYLKFPIFQTVSGKLSWSHYAELLSVSDELAFSFYYKQTEIENWSVRELKRQVQSSLFERLALSKDKKQVLDLAEKGQIIQTTKDIIKDPYVFEFLQLEQKDQWLEKDLEDALVNKLGQFLLELGKGFAYIGKQYKITLDNNHFFVDLVFYHRILKCFVLIDLKKGKVSHQDIGQMNMYLNYFTSEENTDSDNPPIGIVLGADKNDILVEYATAGITNQLFVSKYELYLPNKEVLKEEMHKLLNTQKD
jgi:predicted nuclease of restriction endonuclease-like (RecB) superfamily